MEDILLIEYLRKKGIINDKEYSELTSRPTHKMEKVEDTHIEPDNKSDKYSNFFDSFKEVTRDMNPSEKGKFVDRLKEYDNKPVEHFSESYAKYVVSNMWHSDEIGNRHRGEKYDMHKAKEVCERCKGMIPPSITYADVYIALNAQYHDYHCLFKKWFGNDIDYQIIESAMTYWFKDEDYGISKLWDHFKDK